MRNFLNTRGCYTKNGLTSVCVQDVANSEPHLAERNVLYA